MQTIECTPDRGWEGIQDALGRAQPGDTVLVKAGTYRGAETLIVTSGVSLVGEADSLLEFDAPRDFSALSTNGHNNIRLSGLALVHLNARKELFRDDGVHQTLRDSNGRYTGRLVGNIIRIEKSRNIQVDHCIVRCCGNPDIGHNAYIGIGVYCSEEVEVSSNSASGNLIYGIRTEDSIAKITSNTIKGCFHGISIHSDNVELTENTCTECEYGIFLYGCSNIRFSLNSCNHNRTGLYVTRSKSSVSVTCSEFLSNSNGIDCRSDLFVLNCLASWNRTGLIAHKNADSEIPSVVVREGVFSENGTGILGGAFQTVHIDDSFFHHNSGAAFLAYVLLVEFSAQRNRFIGNNAGVKIHSNRPETQRLNVRIEDNEFVGNYGPALQLTG